MRNLESVFLYLGLLVVCLSCNDDHSCSDGAQDQFNYNSTTGKCQSCDGKVGYNVFDLDRVQQTRNAECMDLSKKVLITLLKGRSEQSLGYDSLYDFNFRGARFDSAELYFNFIRKSDFSGADLRLLQYGYAAIDGKIDQHTLLPEQGNCNDDLNTILCSR
ncbi:hypothetical protein SAMN04488109_5355 [Chryseolinea serpens]|jgi:hypothetical protein|uniref:Pentapeptide repeat-containing protein n=1 Tax=Chryseolinea serpens TaxID=947013 RepID=A0A1M5VSY6_9BACT|nr:hypothetical protein SAMN04488109_5355 [Chryseolinea serpens]